MNTIAQFSPEIQLISIYVNDFLSTDEELHCDCRSKKKKSHHLLVLFYFC